MTQFRRFGSWCLDRGVILGAALVATSAALIASYSGLAGTAGLAGWAPRVQPMLPLTVDVIAVAAGVLVQRTRDAELRRVAWRGVTTAAAVSVLGNAVDHLWTILHSGDIHSIGAWVRVVLAVIMAAVPAVGIAYVVHLLALMTGTEDAPAAEAAPAAPTPDDRLTVPEDDDDTPAAELFTLPTPRHAAPPRTGTKRAHGLALIAAAEAAGTPVTSQGLADALGSTLRYAQILIADAEKSA